MTGLNPDRASPSVGMLWQLEREALSIIKGRINASESIRQINKPCIVGPQKLPIDHEWFQRYKFPNQK